MDYAQLTDDDLLVFIGVHRVLINADDLVSLQEMVWVRSLIAAIGQERWRALARQADHDFMTTDELVTALERVSSPTVRDLILSSAREVAESDGLQPEEAHLLERLEASRG